MKTVAVIVQDGFAPFEFGVACEAFGLDRTDDGIPNFDFRIVTPEPGRRAVQARLLAQRRQRPGVRIRGRPRGGLADAQGMVGPHRSASARRRPPRRRARSVAAQRLQRLVHPRRSRSSRRSPRDHALDVRRPDGRDVPLDRRGPGRALRAGRPHHHERRHGRRARCVPAPAASGARRRDDQHDRAPHGRAAAARRRSGAVHPAPAARGREPLALAGHRLDAGEPAHAS